MLDPGFGFGKTLQHNLALFAALPEFAATAYPLLVGLSRKTMIGQLSGKGLDDRMPGSIIAAALAALRGAAIVRVHDVAETLDAIRIAASLSAVGPQITTIP